MFRHNLIFFPCCSSTVVSIFRPPLSPCPTHPHLPPSILPPLALPTSPLYVFLDDPSSFSCYSLLPPLWLLSISSFSLSLPSFLPPSLPSFLPSPSFPPSLPSFLPSPSFPPSLPSVLPSFLPSFLPSSLPSFLPSFFLLHGWWEYEWYNHSIKPLSSFLKH